MIRMLPRCLTLPSRVFRRRSPRCPRAVDLTIPADPIDTVGQPRNSALGELGKAIWSVRPSHGAVTGCAEPKPREPCIADEEKKAPRLMAGFACCKEIRHYPAFRGLSGRILGDAAVPVDVSLRAGSPPGVPPGLVCAAACGPNIGRGSSAAPGSVAAAGARRVISSLGRRKRWRYVRMTGNRTGPVAHARNSQFAHDS